MDNITCPIADRSAQSGQDLFLIHPDGELTYRDFDRRVSILSHELTAQGVSDGSRVAILADTDELYITLLFALWRLGAVACPLSPKIPATQVSEMVTLAGCAFVWDRSGRLSPRSLGAAAHLTIFPSDSGHSPDRAAERQWQLDRPATIVFTSGSSGFPKAAVLSLGNHYFSATGSNENILLGPGHRWLLSLPLYHVGGLAILFRVAIAGATIVIPPRDCEMSDLIAQSNITHVSMVSTQLYRLLSRPVSLDKLGSLKAILLGGSAIPRHQVEDAWSKGLPAFLSYGLTEMASQVTTTVGEPRYSSGKPLKYREIKIATDGEILVKGRTLFLGYLEGDKVVPAVDRDGWFHTGDIGELDRQGNLLVIGRKDNMFISGGENIHPEEIEAALLEIDEVVEAVVVPVRNPEFGYRPVAFVRTEPAREISAADLTSLPTFKIPIKFYAWPRKFQTGALKLDRRHFHKLVKDMYEHF